MTIEMKKAYLKENGWAKLVRELVEGGGWEVEDAVEHIYDSKTLTREEFFAKYFA